MKRALNAPAQSGSVLVLIIVVVALTSGLALLSGGMIASRTRLATDARVRAELRNAAISAAAESAWMIDGDTNGVDHLREPWASARHLGPVRVEVTDETARLPFPGAGREALAALFARVGGVAPRAAAVQAARLHAWWDQERAVSTNRVLVAEEELLAVPGVDAALLKAVLPRLTVQVADGVNINTVGPDVWLALAAAAGGDAILAERLYARLLRVRERGEVIETLAPTALAARLAADGRRVEAAEVAVLQALAPRLRVESGVFRITATAVQDDVRRTVQAVYVRETARVARWVEW